MAERILDLADRAAIDRHARRSDSVGGMLKRILAAADPDLEFQGLLKDAGFFHHGQAKRRAQIHNLAVAFGMEKPAMKKYLLAAGLVNAGD